MLPIKTLLATLLLAGSAFAVPEPIDDRSVEHAVRDASANPEAEPEVANLAKRACKCTKVKNAGLYCGYCAAVISGWKHDNVYWCNKAGGCDDLGRRTSCVKTEGPCDGRDS
ncbi:uncharacterized protein K460DRAFT_398279 [Cucurbitaria berberidis CBS 394.84]|uniref:Uncharacterized protein n=1 Tax=Cucurbitaria berberidis CBS 394.84 TaxID=1168544 RepID=A0A9P4GBL4_9PLEO|nr:uncharacterized protein K460DRAFT_398279 [Cucurbitaria berberidis CBS 394.84]KAF1842245.1 hypothetical protein K460DRAFT_398279 [Cucurbitaria berberidis CBS 394.84]